MLLLKLDNLIEGTVTKRPSKHIKSPYVADVLLPDGNEVLAHCASLGCCGLADNTASVLLAPSAKFKKDNDKIKCSHSVYLSVLKEKDQINIIGIHPKLAEKLVYSALSNNCISSLKDLKSVKAETPIFIAEKVDSRFDFTGIDSDGVPFIMEVKNVPLADYEDISSKERKKKNYDDRDTNSKIAYFPDGYRKKSEDTVSPRALKHIKELTYLVKQEPKTRCIMCYVIQRTDCLSFQPSYLDSHYRNAFFEAMNAGVEIITLVVSWNSNGEAYFVKDNLPINNE
jgi:DNA-binding sugar fermentation-stimulating protein